mmetsp:Transcript_19095/g.64505  ORF Transcript_19095/g.64505 Transcript_19095/m.64505 type:complete len:207 (+) Transcript_19095:1351-1971(+)
MFREERPILCKVVRILPKSHEEPTVTGRCGGGVRSGAESRRVRRRARGDVRARGAALRDGGCDHRLFTARWGRDAGRARRAVGRAECEPDASYRRRSRPRSTKVCAAAHYVRRRRRQSQTRLCKIGRRRRRLDHRHGVVFRFDKVGHRLRRLAAGRRPRFREGARPRRRQLDRFRRTLRLCERRAQGSSSIRKRRRFAIGGRLSRV